MTEWSGVAPQTMNPEPTPVGGAGRLSRPVPSSLTHCSQRPIRHPSAADICRSFREVVPSDNGHVKMHLSPQSHAGYAAAAACYAASIRGRIELHNWLARRNSPLGAQPAKHLAYCKVRRSRPCRSAATRLCGPCSTASEAPSMAKPPPYELP